MKLSVLGATGSVGSRALQVAESLHLEVASMAAGRPTQALLEAIRRVRPAFVAVWDEPTRDFMQEIPSGTRLGVGEDALLEAALWPEVQTVLVAVPDTFGLRATLESLKAGRRVALANKETLVAGGELVEAVRGMGEILPVDSEHAAFFVLLSGRSVPEGAKLWITGSGGALRDWPMARLSEATVDDVLKHPTWRMGRKITVDSATLMNKGLEVIEAHHLFHATYDQIEVALHRESVIHGFVELPDGMLLAQMAVSDMGLPIAQAITWPERPPQVTERLDVRSLGTLHFGTPDPARFPSLQLAYTVGRMGGIFPAVMSAANDAAVAAFLSERIAFTTIYPVVQAVVDRAQGLPSAGLSLETLKEADVWARREVGRAIEEGVFP